MRGYDLPADRGQPPEGVAIMALRKEGQRPPCVRERKTMPVIPLRHVAVYPGVFDPVHLGHLDLIQRGSSLFDRMVVGVGINPEKSPFFTVEERVQLMREVARPYPNVEV